MSKMKEWSRHSDWNFKNKLRLMEAEMHYALKEFDEAASCYVTSIKAAQEHRFTREEGIACELAGNFFYERQLLPTSHRLFMQSIDCYQSCGAHAVAERVKQSVQRKFESTLIEMVHKTITPSETSLSPNKTLSRKRSAECD